MRFHQGESWWLSNEEATGAEQQAALRMENHGDSRKEVILKWLLEMPADKRPSDVTLLQVGVEAFALHPAQVDLRFSRGIGAALKSLHFTRGQRRMGDGTRPLVYYVPDELKNAPMEKRGERRGWYQVAASSSDERGRHSRLLTRDMPEAALFSLRGRRRLVPTADRPINSVVFAVRSDDGASPIATYATSEEIAVEPRVLGCMSARCCI